MRVVPLPGLEAKNATTAGKLVTWLATAAIMVVVWVVETIATTAGKEVTWLETAEHPERVRLTVSLATTAESRVTLQGTAGLDKAVALAVPPVPAVVCDRTTRATNVVVLATAPSNAPLKS